MLFPRVQMLIQFIFIISCGFLTYKLSTMILSAMWLIILGLTIGLLNVATESTVTELIPVVYVIFGKSPPFLQINVELASRNNPVILISDEPLLENPYTKSSNDRTAQRNVTYLDMKKYTKSSQGFVPYYKHLSKDKSQLRYTHELQCFLRWFIVYDYARLHNIQRVFFSDGDSSVFTNITQAYELRSHCDAVINIEYQPSDYHWGGAGEASIWSQRALADFCSFTTKMYIKHLKVLQTKALSGSSVVDMSLLWLWWVAHKKSQLFPHGYHSSDQSSTTTIPSVDSTILYESGRPYHPQECNLSPTAKLRPCSIYYTKHDKSFLYSLTLSMPHTDPNNRLMLCNGMDVVNRTTFDHMHGWQSGSGFSFNFPSVTQASTNNNNSVSKPSAVTQAIVRYGVPSTYTISQSNGGKPESLNDYQQLLNISQTTPVYYNTLHYQGATAKEYIYYDICRVLLFTGDRQIISPSVAARCTEERVTRGDQWGACQNHDVGYWVKDKAPICA